MALGSSAYPDYCNAGKDVDRVFNRLGARALGEVCLGNELDGQAQSVREWQVRRAAEKRDGNGAVWCGLV